VLVWLWVAAVLLATLANAAIIMSQRSGGESLAKIAADTATILLFPACAITGALIVTRQPRNVVGWLLMLEGALIFLWPLDRYYLQLPAAPADPSPLFMLGVWLQGWLWLWLIFPILFVLLFFPTGRLPSRRWRWVGALGLGMVGFFVLFVTFARELGGTSGVWRVPNPIGFIPEEAFPFVPWAVTLVTLAMLAVASVFVRYRGAGTTERQQIKWLLYGGAAFVVVYAAGFLSGEGEGNSQLYNALLSLALLMLPLAIAIGILRYRLYDIDVVIRKTLVYGAVTAMLGLVYFGSVVLLQRLFAGITGVESSPLAIVVSTLVIAALFTPLRRRVQEGIDRRFFRKKYDAQRILQQFAMTARDETDLDSLSSELVRVVQGTLQPERAGVWIRQDRGGS
jgi:hypothetical protein